jgi:enoyl-CoA hydratase/carnithine racemase
VVPGDGMHIVYPLLLGMNRGRYFLLTGQTLDARKALELGLVAEVLPPDRLLARAWELAEDLARRPTLLLRYTRLLLTEALRRQMHDLLGYGLGMELLALGEKPEGPAATSAGPARPEPAEPASAPRSREPAESPPPGSPR